MSMLVINPDDRLTAILGMVHSLKGSISLPVDRDDKTLIAEAWHQQNPCTH